MPPKVSLELAEAAGATAAQVESSSIFLNNRFVRLVGDLEQLRKAKLLFFSGFVCAGLFFVILFVHVATSTNSATAPRQTVIVFTDGRVDDLIALNYLLHRSDMRVPFVIASAGQGSVMSAYRNLVGFYGLATSGPKKPRVPNILIGAPFSSVDRQSHNCTYRRAVTPDRRTSTDSLYGTAHLLRAQRATTMRSVFAATTPQSAPAYFLDTLNAYLVPLALKSVVIVSMGPLTDVATFVQSSAMANRIRRIYVSGGNLGASTSTGSYFGSSFPATTYNLFLDPQAANIVVSPKNGAPDVTVILSDSVAAFPYSSVPGIISNPPAGQPVDQYIAQALSAWSSASSAFPTTAVPRDLAATMQASNPKIKATAAITVATVGVSASTGNIRNAGVLGSVSGNFTAVRIVTNFTNPKLFWSDYFAMTAAPWPA